MPIKGVLQKIKQVDWLVSSAFNLVGCFQHYATILHREKKIFAAVESAAADPGGA